MYKITQRVVVSMCFAVLCAGNHPVFSMDGDGSGTGTVTEKLNVKGCGSDRWVDEITGFSMSYDGTWSLITSRSDFTGTYTDIKPDRSFSLTFSPSSYDKLISGLEAASDELCGLAPDTSSLKDIVVKSFVAKTNNKWTSVSLKLAISATRHDAAASNKTSYAMKAKIGFIPTGCSGEVIGTLWDSDALVYCGNSDPAVITADNALELVSDVIGSGDTGPVLSTARVDGVQNVTVAGPRREGVGAFARHLARRLFNPSLYSNANTDTSSIKADPADLAPVHAASISINETESCDSGTLTLKGKLSNEGIGVLNLVFNECLLDGDVFNGNAQLSINSFDLGYLTYTDAVMEFELLSASGVSGDVALSGTMRDQLDMASSTEILTLDLVIHDGPANKAFKTEGLVITTVYDDWMCPFYVRRSAGGFTIPCMVMWTPLPCSPWPFRLYSSHFRTRAAACC
jgi:hypothetical protein